MLQIDHVYEFLYQEIFNTLEFWYLPGGVPKNKNLDIFDVHVFTQKEISEIKIFFYDQEPLIDQMINSYVKMFTWDNNYSLDELCLLGKNKCFPYGITMSSKRLNTIEASKKKPGRIKILVSSEKSKYLDNIVVEFNLKRLYYFFHGFAALDWYRGYYTLNYNKSIVKPYNYDFISFNRIINNDRSYRIYLVSKLKELGLLDHGLVSFGVTDDIFNDWQDEVADPKTKLSEHARSHAERHLTDINKLVIDNPSIHGSASADIPRTIDRIDYNNNTPNYESFWHIVTETVFYYDKLHLTEKIFKPIVSKQPFMLLASPGNLAYLKSYGFKTFDSVIDESYDTIQDNDLRVEAVVKQLHWYCNLTPGEKTDIIQRLEPIIEYNFDHFYGEFKHIITRELLTNTKTLFKEIGHDDGHINYTNIHHVLTR